MFAVEWGRMNLARFGFPRHFYVIFRFSLIPLQMRPRSPVSSRPHRIISRPTPPKPIVARPNLVHQRLKVIVLNRAGRTAKEIAVQEGIPLSTVSLHMNKYRNSERLEDAPRSGRPSKVSPQAERNIADCHARVQDGRRGRRYFAQMEPG